LSKHLAWLRQEVAQWRAEGLIDGALAQRILSRYPASAERNWSRIVFSSIGAVLVGLGVILFFGYNWQALPKFAKLALVVGALALAHASGLWAARRPEPSRGLIEGLHVLGTMLFGAGIWLVAQIYHIDEHYPNAFLVWSVAALAMAWAMPSIVQAMLALFLVAFWAGVEAFDFRMPVHGAPLIVVLGVLPLAWWRRSPALVFTGLAVLFVVTAFAVAGIHAKSVVPLLFLAAAAALVAGHAAAGTAFPDAGRPLRAVGLLVVVGCSYLLGFKDLAGLLRNVDFSKPGIAVYFVAAGAALAGAIALLARPRAEPWDRYGLWQLGLLAVGAVTVVASLFLPFARSANWITVVVFNALALGYAALLILEGSEHLRPKLVGLGCLLFAMVAIGRYADLFTSLLARSAVFVAIGIVLFLVGNFYARSRRRAQGARP